MTVRISVRGLVQGVGFRPFVARLARALSVTGTVMNAGGIVEITASAPDEAMDEFIHRLQAFPPPGASVTQVLCEPAEEQAFSGFTIIGSADGIADGAPPVLPPDLPLCEDCRRELHDPADRRFRYPFISCVSCGPRYSVMEALPYDRETTVMADFDTCPACGAEYTADGRRRHAQTISCHDCGPQLLLSLPQGELSGEAALDRGIALLQNGGVLAVKGIGGYQLACSPMSEDAVGHLRALKRRDKKPFAVMFPDLDTLKRYCHVSAEEVLLLESPARPIVLLEGGAEQFCPGVSGESRFLGAFLAYTPLHLLLIEACGPLVMTSANHSGEPIIIDDEDMSALDAPELDGILYSKRRIVTPLDDSVARVVGGQVQLLRRSRGYVPLPIALEGHDGPSLFAMGGDLKAAFCLYRQGRAYLSQYLGDMEQHAVHRLYERTVARMERLLGIRPEALVCDRHPGYFTSMLAREWSAERGIPLLTVQHHHAHIASVMAEYALPSCIGIAFDGTGYGDDGAVWGGEFLLCRGASYERAGHLSYVTLTGGDNAARDAALTALCYRLAAGEPPAGEDEADGRAALVAAALANGVNTQRSSSMGRLFDAVSAALGLGGENSYEGECAIKLENAAAASVSAGIPAFPLRFVLRQTDSGLEADQAALFADIQHAMQAGADAGALARGFHDAVAALVLDMCLRVRAQSGENRAALSGGVFANLLLSEACKVLLEREGFEAFFNSAVPSNDSGIGLGQAWLGSFPAASRRWQDA